MSDIRHAKWMRAFKEILDIKATVAPEVMCLDVLSTSVTDLNNSDVSCKGRALYFLNNVLPIEGLLGDKSRHKAQTRVLLTATQRLVLGEEMKIKSKRSHIIDMSGTVLFLLAPAPLESGSPCVFPLASRK